MTTVHASLYRITMILPGYQHRAKTGERATRTQRLMRISAIGDRCPTLDPALYTPIRPASEVGDAHQWPGDVILATHGVGLAHVARVLGGRPIASYPRVEPGPSSERWSPRPRSPTSCLTDSRAGTRRSSCIAQRRPQRTSDDDGHSPVVRQRCRWRSAVSASPQFQENQDAAEHDEGSAVRAAQ